MTIKQKQQDLFTDRQTIPVFRVELVRERSFETPITTCPADVAPVVSGYLRRADREHFVVVMLATNLRIIGLNTAHVGSLDASVVNAREVFKPAILANASKIVVAHNHPSGNLEPSQADIRVTRQLREAAKTLQIDLLDHVIVGSSQNDPNATGFYSFAEAGLI